MDDHVRRLALKLKLRNLPGTVIHHVALLKKTLDVQGIQSSIVKGYCVIWETKEACEHYWLRVDTGDPELPLDLDIAFEVAKLRNRELMALHPVLLETLPPGLTRSDQTEILIRDENLRLYDLYQANPKEFWHEAPKEVATFPVKDFVLQQKQGS